MIKYDPKLTELMDERQYVINEKGLDILIKPVPDGQPGQLDPREAHMMSKMGEFPAPQGEMDMAQVRDAMGFPNLNMNTKEIYTRYIEVPSDGRMVPVWVYWPRRPSGRTDRAGFIYLHGGGWFGGTPFAVENVCRLLAERAGCVVFNVDYALAPENRYPAAVNDCRSVLKYVYDNAREFGVDKTKLCIGGDSAGGNLAASTAMWDRDTGAGMLRYQALIYPAATLAKVTPGYDDTPEFDIIDEQRRIIQPLMGLGKDDGMADIYVGGGCKEDPYVSPAFGEKRGLCSALVATAEYDGLRPQGEAYARQLSEAGVPVRAIRYRGVCHAFIDKLGYLPQTENLVLEIARDVRGL